MRIRLKKRWIALPLLGLAACSGQVSQSVETRATPASIAATEPRFDPAPPPTDSLRVLFIGNSYTYVNDLPAQIQRLAASSDNALPMTFNKVTPGGSTLERSWEEGRARRLIQLGGWSHVVLQEQSTRPIEDREAFLAYARLFDAEIKRVGAKTVFYLTWARENLPETQAVLSEAYRAAADELGAAVAPVGEAWARAATQNPGLALYHEDRSHPFPTGSYLAACVFFATLYGESPEGLDARPLSTLLGDAAEGLPPGADLRMRPGAEIEALPAATAALLQRTAWAVVSGGAGG